MIITENYKTGNLHVSGATLAAGASNIPHDGVWMNQYNPDGESWTHIFERQMVSGQVITVAKAQPMNDETIAAYAKLDLSEQIEAAKAPAQERAKLVAAAEDATGDDKADALLELHEFDNKNA